jgi:hypothetical protein
MWKRERDAGDMEALYVGKVERFVIGKGMQKKGGTDVGKVEGWRKILGM